MTHLVTRHGALEPIDPDNLFHRYTMVVIENGQRTVHRDLTLKGAREAMQKFGKRDLTNWSVVARPAWLQAELEQRKG